mgnify:CR=1 FL=1
MNFRTGFFKESIDLCGCVIDLSYFTIEEALVYGVSIHTDSGINEVPLSATIYFKNSKLEKGDICDELEEQYPGLLDHIQDTKLKLDKMKVFL